MTSLITFRSKLFILLLTLMLIFSPFLFLIENGIEEASASFSEKKSRSEEGGVKHPWPQFQRNEIHTGDYLKNLRGIDKPILQWDNKEKFEDRVHSYSITVGDFRKNIHVVGGGEYDRDVEHIVYAAQYSSDNETIYIVDGQSGESMWEMTLDESVDVETSVLIGNLNGEGGEDIVFADTDGNVYAYEPKITYERNRPKNNRYSWSENNVETDLLWKYETGHEISETSMLLLDVNQDGKMDVVFGHWDSSGNGYLTALDGDDRTGDGTTLWEVELDHGTTQIISTPALVDYKGSRHIWFTVYGTKTSENEDKVWVYRVSAEHGDLFSPVELPATRGATDIGFPAPVVYDVNQDGSPDVVVCVPQDPDNQGSTGSIYIFNRDMTKHQNWRRGIPAKGRIDATPVVGKLHKDYPLTIVVQSWERTGSGMERDYATTYLEAFSPEAKLIWEREIDTQPRDYWEDRAVASPTLFDMDGNGLLDVISATTPKIFALNGSNGNTMDGFPFTLSEEDDDNEHNFRTSMAVGDFDRDGFFDIVIDGLMLTQKIPDLIVTDVKLLHEGERPKHGENIEIEATVRNNGTDSAYNVNVSFYIDGKYIGHQSIGVEKEKSATASVTWKAYEGHHKLLVAVDPNNKKEESNESNNNYTKEFDILSPYDVNIYYNQTFKKAEPGKEAKFVIGIENNGTEEDNFTVEYSTMPEFWNVSLEGISGGKVHLKSKEQKNITVRIEPPQHALKGETERLTLWVNTSQGGKSKNVSLTVEVKQLYKVELNFASEPTQKIVPNEQVTYLILVRNTGNGDDRFKITAQNVPSDWRAKVNSKTSDTINLARGQSKIIYFNVTSPDINSIENDEAYIDVRAESVYNNSAFDEIQTHTEISSIMVEDNEQEVEPGTTHNYTILIYNLGDERDNISLSSYSETEEDDWTHYLNKEYIVLDAKENGEAILSVSVPMTAKPGTKEIIRINTHFENQTDYDGETRAITYAKQIYKVSITKCRFIKNNTELSEYNNKTAFKPGETIGYMFRIKNQGNGEDTIRFEVQGIPSSWGVEISPEKLHLKPYGEEGSSGWLYINITSSQRARAGEEYNMKFLARSTGDSTKKDSYLIKIRVKWTKGFLVEVDSNSKGIKPGNMTSYNVTFENLGNGYDSVEIQIRNGPLAGWEVKWHNESANFTLHLSPFQRITYQLQFRCPEVRHPNAKAGTVDTTTLWTRLNSTHQEREMELTTTVEQLFLGRLLMNRTGDVNPGESISYHGNITNTGNGEEEIHIRLRFIYNEKETSSIGGWSYTLREAEGGDDIEEEVGYYLQLNESLEFYLNLTAPPIDHKNAEAGFVATAVLFFYHIESEEDYRLIKIAFINTTVNQIYDIDVSSNVLLQNVVPTESVNYTLTIKNKGNGEDVIKPEAALVEIEVGQSNPEDWRVEFEKEEVRLARWENTTLNVTVYPPDFEKKPDQGIVANVTLNFLSNAGELDTNTTLYIKAKTSQMMVRGSREKVVVPYKGVNFTLVVARLQNSNSDTLNLKDLKEAGNTIPRDWTVGYYEINGDKQISKVVLNSKLSKKEIRLWVFPRTTETARAGEEHSFKLQLNNGGLVDEELVHVSVGPYYALGLNVSDNTKGGMPGEKVKFECRIENKGNTGDLFFVSVNNKDSEGNIWHVEYSGVSVTEKGEGYAFLDYEEMVNFTVWLTIPQEALAGVTNLTLLVKSESDTSVEARENLSVEVGEVREVALIVLDAEKNSQDDQDVSFTLVVINKGNVEDHYQFEENIDQERYFSTGSFNRTSLFLKPGESGEVKYTVHVVKDTPKGSYDITLLVRSRNKPTIVNYTTVTISVTPKPKPDLVVEEFSIQPTSPDEEDTIVVLISVKNAGLGQAGSFEIVIEIDGTEVKRFDLDYLSSGETKQFQYNTKLSAGKHSLKVRVDAGNKVSETDEDNNFEEIEVEVKEVSKGGGGGALFLALLVVLLLLGGGFYFKRVKVRKKKKKKKSPKKPLTSLKEEKKAEPKEKEKEEKPWEDKISITGEEKPRREEKSQGSLFPVITPCPFCHVKIKIPREGKFKCPQCGEIGFINEKGEAKELAKFPMVINCPECNEKIKVPSAGKFRCPQCQAISEINAAGDIKEKEVDFPLTVVCPFCETKLKVSKAGKFRCSKCKEISKIDVYGNITPLSQLKEEKEAEEEKKEEEVKFPIVKICPSCGESTKIPRPGWNKCEHCSYVMEIDEKGNFTSKLLRDKERELSEYVEPEEMLELRKEISTIKESVQERLERERKEMIEEEEYEGGDEDEDEGGEEEEQYKEMVEFPLILECRYCGKKLRLRQAGKFKCPHCGEIDEIDDYGRYLDES